MKEIIIENPTRIVDASDRAPAGFYGIAYTKTGKYGISWEHSFDYGWFFASSRTDGSMREGYVCRNPVLCASLASFYEKSGGPWPVGSEIPVLSTEDAEKYIRKSGIPADGWQSFLQRVSDD